ncbi:MAG TPA: molybdopterin converting factor subunit 1 [Noviherbaspirillum sp.]
MRIQLRFFASLREALGASQEVLEVPAEVRTVGELRTWLRARGGAWEQALGEGRAVRMACNQQMSGPDAALSEGAEVAFFPPVTGG